MADIAAKLQKALASETACDTGLSLESGNVFKCHSLVLKLNSSFFESKFKEEWTDKSDFTQVVCDQFKDDVVINLVKFLYGIPCLLQENTIQDYLGCAVYLGVPDFIKVCSNYLKNHLSCANVFFTLKISSEYGQEEVSQLCYELLDEHFEESISATDSFCELDKELVLSIIQRESLSVHEEFLFTCLLAYSDAIGDEEFLTECAEFISFRSMSLDFYVAECMKHNVLPFEKQNMILMYLSSSSYKVDEVQDNFFPSRKIIGTTDCVAHRSYEVSDSGSWKCDDLNGDRIQFKCNTDLTLKAVNIFGSPASSAFFTLSVYTSENNTLIDECTCRVDFSEDETYKGIRFKKCIPLLKDEVYTLQLRTKNFKTYFGISCVSKAGITLPDGRTGEIEFLDADSGSSSVTEGTWINIIRNGLRSFKYLQNKLIPALGLKRRGSLTTDLDTVINLSLKEIQNGVGGSEQLRRTLATKYQLRITRLVSRELIKLLDNEGLERRRKNRLRRRLYMSKDCHGPRVVILEEHHLFQQLPFSLKQINGYDKLSPYGICIHGCIDGFSRKVIWLKAGITNRRPEVVGKYFLDAVLSEGGFPRRVRADCGTENVIVAEIQREVSGDDGFFIYGQSTSNQRIERWWGALRHTRSDFWMQQFKLLEEEERLRKDNGLHRFCLQYSFMAFINKQLEEVRVLWNNHSIRSQKKGNSIPGIPEILHKETEVYGVVDYIQPIPNIQNYIQQCTTDFLNFDEDLKDIAESISVALGLPSPDDITEFSTAADLFIVLSDVMQNIIV